MANFRKWTKRLGIALLALLASVAAVTDETTSSTGWVHFDGQTFTEVPGAGLTRRQGARAVYSPRANLTLLTSQSIGISMVQSW